VYICCSWIISFCISVCLKILIDNLALFQINKIESRVVAKRHELLCIVNHDEQTFFTGIIRKIILQHTTEFIIRQIQNHKAVCMKLGIVPAMDKVVNIKSSGMRRVET